MVFHRGGSFFFHLWLLWSDKKMPCDFIFVYEAHFCRQLELQRSVSWTHLISSSICGIRALTWQCSVSRSVSFLCSQCYDVICTFIGSIVLPRFKSYFPAVEWIAVGNCRISLLSLRSILLLFGQVAYKTWLVCVHLQFLLYQTVDLSQLH